MTSNKYPDAGTLGISGRALHMEFQNLRDLISTNIFDVTRSATTLEKALKTIGTSTDSKVLRLELQAVQTSTKLNITNITRDLKKLRAIAENVNDENGTSKLVTNRLEIDFRSHVERYTNLQKQMILKMKHNPILRKPSNPVEMTGNNDNLQLIENEETEHQLQETMTMEIDFAVDLDTATRVQQIESDITDIHEIMTQLGSMVHEQGEIIDTIDTNIEHVGVNVEAGTQELHRASSLANKKRKCLFGVAIVGIIALVILIVVLVYNH